MLAGPTVMTRRERRQRFYYATDRNGTNDQVKAASDARHSAGASTVTVLTASTCHNTLKTRARPATTRTYTCPPWRAMSPHGSRSRKQRYAREHYARMTPNGDGKTAAQNSPGRAPTRAIT